MDVLEIVGSRPCSAMSNYSRNSSRIGNFTERNDDYSQNPLTKTYNLQRVITKNTSPVFRSGLYSSANNKVIKETFTNQKNSIYGNYKKNSIHKSTNRSSNIDEPSFSKSKTIDKFTDNPYNKSSNKLNYEQTFCESTNDLRKKSSNINSKNINHISLPNTLKKPKHLKKFASTFIDETLFGPTISQPNFPAPWEDVSTKVRPQFCDQSCVTMDKSATEKRKLYEEHSKNIVPWK